MDGKGFVKGESASGTLTIEQNAWLDDLSNRPFNHLMCFLENEFLIVPEFLFRGPDRLKIQKKPEN